MKIRPQEINAALVAFFGPNEPLSEANYEGMKAAIEAAYRARKARKKAAKVDRVTKAAVQGVRENLSQVVHNPNSRFSQTEKQDREAALRKLGSAIAREFPGVSG